MMSRRRSRRARAFSARRTRSGGSWAWRRSAAPATACQDEGTCQDGECERPDAGDLEFAWRQQLDGVPVEEPGTPVLLVQDGALFASVCGGDAGCRLVSYTAGGVLIDREVFRRIA